MTAKLLSFVYYLAVCALLMCPFASAQGPTITSFDPPGSLQTVPLSINTAGSVTGYYSDGTAVHGFLRTSDGSITSFDGPGGTGTNPYSINAAGAITGSYIASRGFFGFHGFLREPDGSLATFDPPGSIFWSEPQN